MHRRKIWKLPGQVIYPETENWGLGFGQEGEKPTGNVSAEELKTYHAAYMDPTDEKVIYLTFDAGYENGNTPAILEALKKAQCEGHFFCSWKLSRNQSGTGKTDGGGRSYGGKSHLAPSGNVKNL